MRSLLKATRSFDTLSCTEKKQQRKAIDKGCEECMYIHSSHPLFLCLESTHLWKGQVGKINNSVRSKWDDKHIG